MLPSMPTAGVAGTRSECLCDVPGRAQLPSLLPLWHQVSCAVPVPRIQLRRVHSTSFDSAASPSLRGELPSPLRGCPSSLEAGGRGPTCLVPLGPKGAPNVRCATEGLILPEHSDDLRGRDPARWPHRRLVRARGLFFFLPRPRRRPPYRAGCQRCPGLIAAGCLRVPCQLNPAIVDCLRLQW